jgi:hypothetical protein
MAAMLSYSVLAEVSTVASGLIEKLVKSRRVAERKIKSIMVFMV